MDAVARVPLGSVSLSFAAASRTKRRNGVERLVTPTTPALLTGTAAKNPPREFEVVSTSIASLSALKPRSPSLSSHTWIGEPAVKPRPDSVMVSPSCLSRMAPTRASLLSTLEILLRIATSPSVVRVPRACAMATFCFANGWSVIARSACTTPAVALASSSPLSLIAAAVGPTWIVTVSPDRNPPALTRMLSPMRRVMDETVRPEAGSINWKPPGEMSRTATIAAAPVVSIDQVPPSMSAGNCSETENAPPASVVISPVVSFAVPTATPFGPPPSVRSPGATSNAVNPLRRRSVPTDAELLKFSPVTPTKSPGFASVSRVTVTTCTAPPEADTLVARSSGSALGRENRNVVVAAAPLMPPCAWTVTDPEEASVNGTVNDPTIAPVAAFAVIVPGAVVTG